jgi:copper resistance protein C
MTSKVFVLLTAVVILSVPVLAHAILLKSTPAAGAVITGPDVSIVLEFNSRIDSARSTVSLFTPGQAAQKLDVKPQAEPGTLVAPAARVAPGEYQVRWQVLATDGHITRGEFSFTVK